MIEFFYVMVMTHITIVCVTLFLHRAQAHKAIEFNFIVSHAMRFWLWLTTGMVTKQWVAVHRKHHRYSDQQHDPHSPMIYGIRRVLIQGAWLYNTASKDKHMVDTYGVGSPDDWIERKVYTPHSKLGLAILLIFNILIFGWIGIFLWATQMIWIPFWAAGVINGLGHWFGYRNGQTKDNSQNLIPFGIIVGGEELHNNHHLNPASPKLSKKWFEFDIGWMYLKILEKLRLAKIRHS